MLNVKKELQKLVALQCSTESKTVQNKTLDKLLQIALDFQPLHHQDSNDSNTFDANTKIDILFENHLNRLKFYGAHETAIKLFEKLFSMFPVQNNSLCTLLKVLLSMNSNQHALSLQNITEFGRKILVSMGQVTPQELSEFFAPQNEFVLDPRFKILDEVRKEPTFQFSFMSDQQQVVDESEDVEMNTTISEISSYFFQNFDQEALISMTDSSKISEDVPLIDASFVSPIPKSNSSSFYLSNSSDGVKNSFIDWLQIDSFASESEQCECSELFSTEFFKMIYKKSCIQHVQTIKATKIDLLFNDCILVLQGIPSSTFVVHPQHLEFHINPIRVDMYSVTALRNHLEHYSRMGTIILRFQKLIEYLNQSKFIIHHAFASSLQNYLLFCFHCILSAEQLCEVSNLTVMNLILQLQPVLKPLEYFYSTLSGGMGLVEVTFSIIQNPANLLSLLHDYLFLLHESEQKDSLLFRLVLFCFNNSFEPLMNWILQWIYKGQIQSTEEFFIKCSDSRQLNLNNYHQAEIIWSQTFQLDEKLVPNFLQSLKKEIFQVGFQLNIIRKYSKSHFLVNSFFKKTHFDLNVIYSKKDLLQVKQMYLTISIYQNRLHEAYIQMLMQRERKAKFERNRKTMLNLKLISEQYKKYEQFMKDILLKQKQQKQLLLEERIAEINEWKRLNALKTQQEKDEIKRKETERLQKEQQLIEMAKKQILQEYEKKVFDLEKRKQRQDWRYRRMLLNEKRKQKLNSPIVYDSPKEHLMTDNEQVIDPSSSSSQTGTEELQQQQQQQQEDEMMEDPNTSILSSSTTQLVEDEVMDDTAPMIILNNPASTVVSSAIPSTMTTPIRVTLNQNITTSTGKRSIATSDKTSETDVSIDYDELLEDSTKDEFINALSEFNKLYENMDSTKEDSISSIELYQKAEIHLTQVIQECIHFPILTQWSTMNSIMLSIFFNELKLDKHFSTLRRYYLMQAGEFSDAFCRAYFKDLTRGKYMKSISMDNDASLLSHTFKTVLKECDFETEEMSFAERFYFEPVSSTDQFKKDANSLEALETLQLCYKLEWPLNVIINEKCIQHYQKLHQFMLKLKRVELILEDIWITFRQGKNNSKGNLDSKIKIIHLFRQEIQHFSTIMQQYIMNQVLELSTQEFLNKLEEIQKSKDKNLFDLRMIHEEYLEKCINRCLLNSKAKPIFQFIHQIFVEIMKFYLCVVNHRILGTREEEEESLSENAFSMIMQIRNSFRSNASFLHSMLQKLDARGLSADDSLKSFILRLNFNNFYGIDSPNSFQ